MPSYYLSEDLARFGEMAKTNPKLFDLFMKWYAATMEKGALMAFRVGTPPRASAGKNFRTGSSRLNLPSAIASPTAVELKLLLSECNTCGLSAASGFHQPSAITRPCRTSMKLCNVFILSAEATKSRMAWDEMPWLSGVLRGSGRLAAGDTVIGAPQIGRSGMCYAARSCGP